MVLQLYLLFPSKKMFWKIIITKQRIIKIRPILLIIWKKAISHYQLNKSINYLKLITIRLKDLILMAKIAIKTKLIILIILKSIKLKNVSWMHNRIGPKKLEKYREIKQICHNWTTKYSKK
jgi:hypothetical protein